MIIHKLKIQNFKSYNNLHTFGPFDAHFTCVIGPNGNGKSNIIDAVLFVFGFKSSKLRQDNLSSLIHKSAFAKPQQATVMVIFKEGQEIIQVSRTVFKSGHSYYRHNGEKIGWMELREKLVSKKIDLNKNLFIILQGQVQRLCELSPQKMVEYIQYVSGSDQFKETIDQNEKKYIQKSISKEQIRAILSIKRKIYENLKQRAVQQSTWIILKMKVMLFQHLVLKKIFYQNYLNLIVLQQAQKDQIFACQKIQIEIRQNQQKILQKKQELKQITSEFSKGQIFIDQIQQKIDKLSIKIKQQNRQINYFIKDKQKKQQQRQRIISEINQLNKISKQHQEFIHRNYQICTEIKKYQEINKLKICYEIQEKLKEATVQNQLLTLKYRENKVKLQTDREKLKIYQEKYKENKQFIIKCKKSLKQISEQIQEIHTTLTQNQQSLIQLQRQINEKPTQKIQTNQQKILNELKSANKLKSLCNDITLLTLRQLIIIDPIYADVVETILPHLDYFIVENIKQAKEILDYLNRRKLGRMTVLIKQSIVQAIQDVKFCTVSPKETKLLYQACKCTDQQTKKIIMWALGNTLVTNKLQIAMKVAYYDDKKYRVITTNGEFIDTSGTMTKLPLKNGKDKYNQEHLIKKQGTIKKNIIGLVQRKKQLEKKKEELQVVLLHVENQERSLDGLDEVFLQEMQGELTENMEKITKNQKQINNLNDSLNKIKNKVKNSGFNIKDYEKVLSLLKQQKQNESKVKKIQNSNNLLQTLQKKNKEILECIKKMNKTIEQKIKQKALLQTENLKFTELIQQKNKQFEIIKYAITLIQEQIKSIEGIRKALQEQLGDSNKKNNFLPQPKEELKRIRYKIKSAEIQKLQLLSKLFQSIKQIKQFSFIIYKTVLSKCPELIPTKTNDSPSPQPQKQFTINSIIEENILVLGKNEYKFPIFLNQKQKMLLSNQIKHNGNIYNQIDDIRPSNPQADIIFQSLSSKQIKFGHSFELQKIKHYQKQITKSQDYQIDFELFDQYIQKKKQFQIQLHQLTLINNSIQILKNTLIQLRNKRLNIFMTNFNEINIELNKIYMQLTGGRAEINLIDSMNPLQGIQFSVRPVNKSWKRVNLLSGGEKTFTSLALIFACQQIKKFPFYFMDQIDAALDYKNTTLLAQYITGKKNTQHIVISLRKNMYQECNRVIGVYKIKDQSRIVEMDMSEIQRRGQGEEGKDEE